MVDAPARTTPPTTTRPPSSGDSTAGIDAHLPELDGVRGVAILLVTLYRFVWELDPTSHPAVAMVRKFSPIGERGVELFFVLSGFLITRILLRTKAQPNYFRNFFVRRSLRIFPLYYLALVILLYVIPHWVDRPGFELARQNQIFLWTYTANLWMSWKNEWNFGALDHFWSLAIEEHFYWVWPIVVYFMTDRRLIRLCVLTIGVVFVARTLAAFSPACDVAVDVFTLFRCDSLCLGGLLAVASQLGYGHRDIVRLARWVLPGLVVVMTVFIIHRGRLLGIANTLCPIFWALFVGLMLTSPSASWSKLVLRWPVLRWLGKYSYGMYVVQRPLVVFFPFTMAADWLRPGSLGGIGQSVLYVVAMCGLTGAFAYMSYHLWEAPFLRLKRRFE